MGGRGFGFQDMFGGRRGTRAIRGQDLLTELSVTLEEVANGTTKTINIERTESCEDCDGKGGTGISRCGTCDGQGMVRQAHRTAFGVFAVQSSCRDCRGSGETYETRCKSCRGKGRVLREREIEVRVPEGVYTGTKLRLAGQGEGGARGGRAGDLYVMIRVLPHERFTREGNDLQLDQPISFATACFGGTVEVQTLNGKAAKLKIPAATQSNAEFRLSGKGIRGLDGYTGDLVVRAVIEVPKKLSKKQKEHLEAFEKESGGKAKAKKRFLF